jgi:hypothetical protein
MLNATSGCLIKSILAGMAGLMLGGNLPAMERFFGYTYEPETMPARALEYEQWVTLRALRNGAVGQNDFQRWEIREELEYGVTDDYSVSLYLNESAEAYHTSSAGSHSLSHFDGVSIENRYMLWNPTEHRVGLTLYLEPRFGGQDAEVEEKIILGQRIGSWKWAFNLTHATEWLNHFRGTEGEVELSLGINRELSTRWYLGLELRDHNELPEYREWENTAVFLGPVVTYRREHWWTTLTVMPQIFGANFLGNADRDHSFDLEGHERLNVRLMVGVGF